LVLILDCWGSDWSLLTGGNFSEVFVTTGLTVFAKFVSESSSFSQIPVFALPTSSILVALRSDLADVNGGSYLTNKSILSEKKYLNNLNV
jgi:hypothetical protein